ncbi:MAG: tRNA uracil 4-sulfurtransferase ThiI [Spirochaetota bacterium]
MEVLFLARFGELALKGENRPYFERKLRFDIEKKLEGIHFDITTARSRLYISTSLEDAPAVAGALSRTFGLVSFARAEAVPKQMPVVEQQAVKITQSLLQKGNRFKIEARRSDKSFELNSYQIACRLGDVLLSRFPQLKVDVHNPEWILHVEVRDKVYLYGPPSPSPRGLPIGCSGRAVLLLSGGIDSPVAGYLMGKRGLEVDAVYFDTPPFSSEKAKAKAEKLVNILSDYITGMSLRVVPFTDIQVRIKQQAPQKEMTLLMRACMMDIASIIAEQNNYNSLITGESLGQVASQTPESLRFTQSTSRLPVFRPLLGLDKEEIVKIARHIGSFETSILPYQDCCTLFTPTHPLIRPDFERMNNSYTALEIDELVQKAAAQAVITTNGKKEAANEA